MAIKMVREFGLSSAVGPVGYPLGGSVFLDGGVGAFSSRPFAEHTQAAIDAEVSRLLSQAEQRAVKLLNEHRVELDALVEMLIARETVDGSDVYALVGKPEPVSGGGVTMAPDRTVPVTEEAATAQSSKAVSEALPPVESPSE
jgi:cell division protease FtsH